jgi:hypothetical protein
LLARFAREDEMTKMRWVEGAAEEADVGGHA